MTARVFTGASHAELCLLLTEYATVIRSTRHLDGEKVADALAGFADTLQNLHSEPGDDRDALTLDEWRAEIGLCGDHLTADCHVHQCESYVAELEAVAPWGTSRSGLKGWAE